jgi:mRNA interferase RelE/StbE
LSAGWRYEFFPRARRDLRRLDPPVSRRILAALDQLIEDPSTADIRKLQGQEEWRLRGG